MDVSPGLQEQFSLSDGAVRRRGAPVQTPHAHFDWHVLPSDTLDDGQDQGVCVFNEEEPSKFEEYVAMFCDYMYWILLAYCASNLVIFLGEKAGVLSPQFDEWNPVRWWHNNSAGLQKELFDNATAAATTMAHFQGLKTWIEEGDGGWVSHKLLVNDYFSEQGRYERRLEVREDVDKGEVLVKLPLSHVLSSDFCQQDLADSIVRQVVEAQKKSSQSIDIAPWTWIALYILAHSHESRGVDSSVRFRFNVLFRSDYVDAALSYMPLFWDDESLHWLNGTDFLNVHLIDLHAAIESEYHRLVYLVPSIESGIPIIEFKKWAMVVMSRGDPIDLPDRENNTKMVAQLAILPLVDFVDHHLPVPERTLNTYDDLQQYQEQESRTEVSYNQEMGAVLLRARDHLPANGAVTSAYGVRSNADYLLYHGFTMPRSWSDRTLCAQYVMIELPLPRDIPTWKSKFLVHPYRFVAPPCPSWKATPHIFLGAARFLTATENDVLDFEARLLQDPMLLERGFVPKDEKFLHHGAKEALSVVCDTNAAPPLCKSVLTVENEVAAWDFIRNQSIARVAQHIASIEEDSRILKEDEETSALTINHRHAIIVRREEKLTLRRWCSIAVRTAEFLHTNAGKEECTMTRVPDDTVLENEEPRLRPLYWSRLLTPIYESDIPDVCRPR